jgi:TetR/AcrR family transcriptional repressor of nem operon
MALYTQAVIQGAFILAKAKDGPAVAVECLTHLRRYLETQLTPTDPRANPKRRRSHV